MNWKTATVTVLTVVIGLGLPTTSPPLSDGVVLAKKEGIRVFTDLSYHEHHRNVLDIYCPDTTEKVPVLMFVHGGGWCEGSKDQYAHIGRHFAKHGFCTVVINYRLSPEVKHPDHTIDAARAFAWVKDNISRFNGDEKRVSLMGHSAGGHMAALIASDPSYLGRFGHSPKEVHSLVGVSGVYHIGLMTTLAGYTHVFQGSDKDGASPMSYQPACPVLLVYGENDYRSMPRQAQTYHDRIIHAGGTCELKMAPSENHESIIINACLDDKAYNQWILQFLKK